MQIALTPTPDRDTATAIAAAIACAIEEKPVCTTPDAPPRSSWRAAAALAAQRLPPTRNAAHAAWPAADRARRAERWSYGITGI